MADKSKKPQSKPLFKEKVQGKYIGESQESLEQLRKAAEIPPRTGGTTDSSSDSNKDK